ncbi:MAG: hypothetical protein RSF70_07235 [Ruthenibacterium sp.]
MQKCLAALLSKPQYNPWRSQTLSAKLSKQEQDALSEKLLQYRKETPTLRDAANADGAAARDAAIKAQLAHTRKSKMLRMVALAVLFALLLGFGSCFAWRQMHRDAHAEDMEAFAGTLPGKTQAEIEADLNRIIKDSEFNVTMSSVVAIEGDKGKVNIENIAANHFLMQVDIVYTNPETAEQTVIYQSGVIKPGYSIAEATMKNTLPHGGDGDMTVYDAVATFHALDPDSKREVGATQLNLVLAYQNKAEGK